MCIGVWVRNCLPQAQTLSYPNSDFIQPSCFLAPPPRLVLHLCLQLSLSCFHFTLPRRLTGHLPSLTLPQSYEPSPGPAPVP